MKRALAIFNAVVAVAAIVTAWAWPAEGQQPAIEVHKVDEGYFDPAPGQPFFVLVVGNDGRAGLEGIRGDALHLVGVNPSAKAITIINIPRDTYVNVVNRGMDKITMGYYYGGLQGQVQTVHNFTGVPFSFVVTTNFDGFQAMVDEMGGVDLHVPYRMFDTASGADFHPGMNHLSGAAALSWSRNRHMPNGDIARTTNQGWLMIAALQTAQAQVHNPADALRLMGIMASHTQFEGVSLTETYRLLRLCLTVDSAAVRNVTMPSVIGKAGKAEVVYAGAGTDTLFADFRDDAVLQSH